MQKQSYEQFNEAIYHETLPNGLKLHVLPKAGFHKTFAVMTTNYGSVDNTFVPRNETEMRRFPDGIAHFLEHKLFEKKDYDAFELFGQYGASANAFTTFTNTSYLFSTADHVHENLDILLDFVQQPYFTDKTVNKEKGIIGQEIKMYDDDPDWRLYFGLIGQMYPNDPMHIDIAGTVESIDQITPDDLMAAYNVFYHPSNMSLFVVGDVEAEAVKTWVSDNQATKTFLPIEPIIRQPRPVPTTADLIARNESTAKIERSKISIGIKGVDDVPAGKAGMTYDSALSVGFDMLFDDGADDYDRLYNTGIIDDSFSTAFDISRGSHFATISGDTDQPEVFEREVKQILAHSDQMLADNQAGFELVKRETLGRMISAMNSIEAVANDYDDFLFAGSNVFDEVQVLERLTLNEVRQAMQQFVNEQAMVVRIMRPEASNQKD